jgi:lipoic acid synthetase
MEEVVGVAEPARSWSTFRGVVWRVPPASKPPWLRVRLYPTYSLRSVAELSRMGINTVCSESLCPNIPRCWGRGEATFIILGRECTRRCRFCAVRYSPKPPPPDPDEPYRVARAVELLRLRYVVVTSVDRDDLPDYGASHFAETVKAIKKRNPDVKVEALIPDFNGRCSLVGEVVEAGVDVIAHNLETVERLTPLVRDERASYGKSLNVLRCAKRYEVVVKTGVLVGLGEEVDDLVKLFQDVASLGVHILTIGQYLRPTPHQLPVAFYVTPQGFKVLGEEARRAGVPVVVSGPLVRSSFAAFLAYRAALAYLRGESNGSLILAI